IDRAMIWMDAERTERYLQCAILRAIERDGELWQASVQMETAGGESFLLRATALARQFDSAKRLNGRPSRSKSRWNRWLHRESPALLTMRFRGGWPDWMT